MAPFLLVNQCFINVPAVKRALKQITTVTKPLAPEPCMYGWAFGLPENFGSGSSGFGYFGFPKMLPEISLEKEEPENSGTRKFGFGFTRTTRIKDTAVAMAACGAHLCGDRRAPRRWARRRRRPAGS